MNVNQEIEALVTMGIDPTEFLVVPRVLALCVMMPLLCLYADLIGRAVSELAQRVASAIRS